MKSPFAPSRTNIISWSLVLETVLVESTNTVNRRSSIEIVDKIDKIVERNWQIILDSVIELYLYLSSKDKFFSNKLYTLNAN